MTRNAFANAQHATMRQVPTVILVGELRHPETIALAITSAEFSLSTAHSSSRTGNSLGSIAIACSSNRFPQPIVLDGEFYHARAVFPSLPEQYDKFRFVTKFIELIAEPYPQDPGRYGIEMTLSTTFPLDKELPIRDVDSAAGVALMAIATEESPMTLVVSSEFGASTLRPDKVGPLSAEHTELLRYFADVVRVCLAFGLKGDDCICLGDSLDYKRYFDYLKVTIWEQEKGPLELGTGVAVSEGTTVGAVNFCSAPAGRFMLLATYAVYGTVTKCEVVKPSKFRIIADKAQLHIEKNVIPMDDWPSYDLKVHSRRATEWLIAQKIEAIFGDPTVKRPEQ